MNLTILVYFFSLVLSLFPEGLRARTLDINELSIFEINSAITPATFDYLNSNFKRLSPNSFIIIKMNTPGGLVSTTKEIITLIGKSTNPVAIWITPEGASAASAGSIIASASHLILMSPGTNLGAATPVGLGEDIKENDGRRKSMNDLMALVRAVSDERGRPSKPFEEMIEKASSFTDKEAKDLKIAHIASNLEEIKKIASSLSLRVQSEDIQVQFSPEIVVKEYEPTPGQKLLEVLANPTTAYFLFLLAIALIYFEFQAPGGYVAGAIGTSLLVIAGIAFQVLPLDWGAFSLILIGIALLIIEIYVTSYGLLFVAGLVFFVMGSLFLFQDHTGFISIQYSTLFSALAGLLVSMGGITWYLWKEKKSRSPQDNFFLPENSHGIVMGVVGDYYQVKVRGEIWKAISNEALHVQDQIIVTKVDSEKLLLEVKKKPTF